MNRKTCVITGTRADYGLLRGVIEGIGRAEGLELQVIATGMHLSPEFGLTYNEIEQDGIPIDSKVEMLLSSDSPTAVAKSMGLALMGIADALQLLQPDLVVVLGDRFEIFSAVCAAMVARIPVAHISGGETTEGAFDEAIRHSITKMSHLHFVSTKEYFKRVVQLGEHPERVFLVGALAVDNIKNINFLTLPQLEESLDFRLGDKNLLITFHPVTLEKSTSMQQMTELLNVLDVLGETTHLIFTMPNSDTDGRILFDMIEGFVNEHANAKVYTSLGQLRYLSCIQQVDAVVGNSSSGITEAPILRTATINIGDRQRGRTRTKSIIDCDPNSLSINNAIQKLYSPEFKRMLDQVVHPYGEGGAGNKIIEVLQKFPIQDIVKKSFYNIP